MSNDDYECDDVSTVLMANPRRATLTPTKMNAQATAVRTPTETLADRLIAAVEDADDLELLPRFVRQFFDAGRRTQATAYLNVILGGIENNSNALITALGAVPAGDRQALITMVPEMCDLAIRERTIDESFPNAPSTNSSMSSTAPRETVPYTSQDEPSRGSDEAALRQGHANERGRQLQLPAPVLGAGHGNPQQEQILEMRRVNPMGQLDAVPAAAAPAIAMPAQIANQPGQNQNNPNNNNNPNNFGNPQNF